MSTLWWEGGGGGGGGGGEVAMAILRLNSCIIFLDMDQGSCTCRKQPCPGFLVTLCSFNIHLKKTNMCTL